MSLEHSQKHRQLNVSPHPYPSAWDELHDVFGDGLDYDWALDDDEADYEEEKPDMKLADVS